MSHVSCCFAVALVLVLAAPGAFAAEYKWGAISLDLTDLSPDGGYGIGGGDTEAEASENAQKFCAEEGKACQVVTTYQQCGSVAAKIAGGGGSWGLGATKDEAASRALDKCGGGEVCKTVVTDCN